MNKNFAEYRKMFINLAAFMDVNLQSSIGDNYLDFLSKGLDFTVVLPNQDANAFYKNLSQNPDKLKVLGLTQSNDFLRFQTKQLWYRDSTIYSAPELFDAEYDLWFANQLNRLFDDQVLKGEFKKTQFLKTMFSDLKQRIGISMTHAV